jgi:hypothetical protein
MEMEHLILLKTLITMDFGMPLIVAVLMELMELKVLLV